MSVLRTISWPMQSFKLNKFFHRVSSFSQFSTQASVPDKIYELRVYNSYPKDFKKTLQLFEQYIHLRVKHSKLFGFWTTEIGDSIFQLVHLWEYDSLSHRRKARLNLLQDTAWQTEFLPHLMPCMESMTNALVVPVPGSVVNVDFRNDPAAVYQLQSLEGGAPGPDTSSERNGQLVGRFTAILGSRQTEYRLWRYLDIDDLLAGSRSSSQKSLGRGTSLLLYPVKFSPIS